jgi:uncharacterized protein (TIGR02266 family)
MALQPCAEADDEAGVRESALESAPWDVEPARLVQEFLPLNRRRIRGNPPLDLLELARWEELRDLLEIALGAVPPTPGASRRRALRVRTHLKVLVTNQLAQELLHVHDLSEQGVFLRTQRPLAPGSQLQIELQDRNGTVIELEGSVIWARPIGEGHGPPGMAVAFHALSDWDRAVLADLVESTLTALAR